MKANGTLAVLILAVLSGQVALHAQVTRQENGVPLKNWPTPSFWQPNQTERGASGKAAPQFQLSPSAVSTNALTFVAVTPCRLVDTRGGSFNGIAPFSGPSIGPMGIITIPVQSGTEASTNTAPAPCGVIPSMAQAYSFNLTVVPHGTGGVDYVSVWPAGGTQPFVSTLDDPQGQIVSNAVIVPAGASSGGISLFNAGPAATDVIIDMNGFFAAPTDVNFNTGLGLSTLASDSSGSSNTATGMDALANNTTASNSTAIGAFALFDNVSGNSNTALGSFALEDTTTGAFNVASGYQAMTNNVVGDNNTAIGVQALFSNLSGNGNIAVGRQAAINVTSSNSNNIHIGNTGASGDSAAIKIGTVGTQTTTFIAGISGASVSDGATVFVNSSGQLGVAPSSRRFKEQITDMGNSSNKLFQLRPVNFFYKPEYDDSHLLQYGLIAEEVAKIYPEMVAYDKDGQILTVKYQLLAPMLLNEVQKQNAQLQTQQEENRKLEDRLAALEALLKQAVTTERQANSQ